MPTNIDASTINSYTPTVYWSTTTGTSTGAPITKIDLSGLTITPNNITATCCNSTQQDEYIEKLEKHIDELEEDIEYFNKQLQEKDEMIHYLLDKTCELENKTHELETDSANMNTRLIYLESRIAVVGGQSK